MFNLKTKKDIVRTVFLVIYDILAVIISAILALVIRFDFSWDVRNTLYFDVLREHSLLIIVSSIAIFALFNLYSSIWNYASIREMASILLATGTATILQVSIVYFLNDNILRVPRGYFVLFAGSLFVLIFFSRFIYRGYREIRTNSFGSDKKRVIVIGAGEAGATLIKEIKSNPSLGKRVVGLVDDNRSKLGKYMHGIKVLGVTNDIADIAEQYSVDQILIAIPSASSEEKKRILDLCKKTGKELMILPGMYQIVKGDISISKLKDVDVSDLLGRDAIDVDLASIMSYVSSKVVMVTGGGGSIGSELCRQIALNNPRQLIILDIYENTTYNLEHELKSKFPALNMVTLIGSVRNTKRIDHIFEEYRPDIVYHAAAHKHVPLMETSPNEAVKNNVLGTLKMVKAADKWGVDKFVLISTDKAVNPTNIMGASKRLCEMLVQTYDKKSDTDFVAVRFGNVLGSNGSVIPLFKKQIAEGGPVTVTHPEITRYFMTIPEAVSLVLQAGVYAKGGEIFVLDMGKAVKIADLARNLIFLSGYKPDIDIKIEYVGLRPGEKLYEELLMDEEGMSNTENQSIYIGKPIELDEKKFLKEIEELSAYVENEPDDIRRYVKKLVPTYSPKN